MRGRWEGRGWEGRGGEEGKDGERAMTVVAGVVAI